MPDGVEPSGLSCSPTLHPHQQLVTTKLPPLLSPFLNVPLTILIHALAHRSTVTPLARSQHAHGDPTPFDSELEAGWGQRRSPTSEGCSPTAAAITSVEAVPAVWSRRRYRERRSPRAGLLCRGRRVAAGLIFKLGMGLLLPVANTKMWGRCPRPPVPRCRRLSMLGVPGAAAHDSGMHVSVVM